jgi:hypothetical protein
MTRTLTLGDTVAVTEAALEDAFDGVAFTIAIDFTGTDPAIDIAWTDGPTPTQVLTALDAYTGIHIDQPDQRVESWWCDDHRARVANVGGKLHRLACCPQAELVFFPASMHVTRTLSAGQKALLVARATELFHMTHYRPKARPVPGSDVTVEDIVTALSLDA